MKPYLYIAKMKVLTSMAYRFDVILTIIIQCLVMIATAFFWIAAYGTRESALGTSRAQMLTYIILSAVLACMFSISVEGRVSRSIRDGKVAVDMIKPVNMFGMYLAEDMGGFIVSFFLNILPLLIIASLFIQVPRPASFIHFLLFLLSAILSYMINWIICANFSMLAFWTISIGPLLNIKNILIRILSGSIVPLWFFPQWMQTILRFLPFMYIYQLPLSIYIGKISMEDMIFELSLQIIWIFILYGIFKLFQNKIKSNVLVQGG